MVRLEGYESFLAHLPDRRMVAEKYLVRNFLFIYNAAQPDALRNFDGCRAGGIQRMALRSTNAMWFPSWQRRRKEHLLWRPFAR